MRLYAFRQVMSMPIAERAVVKMLIEQNQEHDGMEIHERLKSARERMFQSAAEAASAMGINYQTYAAHENGSRGLRRDAAMRYAKFFNVSLEFLLTGRKTTYSRNDNTSRAAIVVDGDGMPVKGFVRAGIWQESYVPEGDITTLPISADSRFPHHLQYALEIQGDSLDRRAKPGEYAVCVEWHGPVQPEDVVIVERRRAGLFEATVKVARPGAPGTIHLCPDSNNPAHKPIVIHESDLRDGEEIAIVGKVLGYYRRA